MKYEEVYLETDDAGYEAFLAQGQQSDDSQFYNQEYPEDLTREEYDELQHPPYGWADKVLKKSTHVIIGVFIAISAHMLHRSYIYSDPGCRNYIAPHSIPKEEFISTQSTEFNAEFAVIYEGLDDNGNPVICLTDRQSKIIEEMTDKDKADLNSK